MPPKAARASKEPSKEPTTKAAKSKADGKNLPWTERMQLLLLTLVQQTGAHVKGGKSSTAAWNEINKLFFEDDELKPFKAKHYKCDTGTKEDWRKLRDKYKLMGPNISTVMPYALSTV